MDVSEYNYAVRLGYLGQLIKYGTVVLCLFHIHYLCIATLGLHISSSARVCGSMCLCMGGVLHIHTHTHTHWLIFMLMCIYRESFAKNSWCTRWLHLTVPTSFAVAFFCGDIRILFFYILVVGWHILWGISNRTPNQDPMLFIYISKSSFTYLYTCRWIDIHIHTLTHTLTSTHTLTRASFDKYIIFCCYNIHCYTWLVQTIASRSSVELFNHRESFSFV